MDTSDARPRVSAAMLPGFVGKKVLLVGKVRDEGVREERSPFPNRSKTNARRSPSHAPRPPLSILPSLDRERGQQCRHRHRLRRRARGRDSGGRRAGRGPGRSRRGIRLRRVRPRRGGGGWDALAPERQLW